MPVDKNKDRFPEGAVIRDVDTYTLKQLRNLDLITPERLYIQMNDEEHAFCTGVDVGILCYSKREAPSVGIGNRSYWVNPQSLKVSRRELVVNLLDKAFCSDWRQSTFANHAKLIISVIFWCDTNGYPNFLDSLDESLIAYRDYSDYLYQMIMAGSISRRFASKKQNTFLLMIELQFGPDAMVAARRHVARMKSETPVADAPEEQHVSLYVATLLGLARALSKQLMEGAQFPFRVDMPGYSTYYFHSQGNNVKTPYFEPRAYCLNFEEGRLASVDEYLSHSSSTDISCAVKNLRNASEFITACNKNLDCAARLKTIAFALNAYNALFLLLTGANPSQFIRLEYSEALEIAEGTVKKEFTAVKFRAQGKLVRYPIGGKQGLRMLREYLVFRAWVLGKEKIKYLFFNLSNDNNKKEKFAAVRLSHSFQSNLFYNRLRGKYIPQDIPNISASAGRKFKSIILHALKIKPQIVADVLGHSSQVNLKNYSKGDKSTSFSEFELHWQSVRAAAERVKTTNEITASDDVPTVSGHCEAIGKPKEITVNIPIKPNCNTMHGCLYCEHYTCHADEEDARKLLSLLFVIRSVRKLSQDAEHADNLLKDVCIRIEVILKAIAETSERAAEMLFRLRKEVDEYGRLTPFWAARMERYEAMGVVV